MIDRKFLLFTICISLVFLTSCSKIRDKVLGRTSSSSSPAITGDSYAALTTPDSFQKLLYNVTILREDANAFVSKYYSPNKTQSQLAVDLRKSVDVLPFLVREAISLLSNNTNDGFSPLNFRGNFVSRSTILSVISKLYEYNNALSTANTALGTFCINDPVVINLNDARYLENLINELSNSVNDIISELRSLQ
jgi:hypothetical protein